MALSLESESRHLGIARGVSFGLAALALLFTVGDLVSGRGAGVSIDWRPFPLWASWGFQLWLAGALAAHALRPVSAAGASRVRHTVTFLTLLFVLTLCAGRGLTDLALSLGGLRAPTLALLPLAWAGLLSVVLVSLGRRDPLPSAASADPEADPEAALALRPPLRPAPRWALAAAALTLGLYPTLVMASLGPAAAAGDADMVVVFGARTYADGRPSHALIDRVDRAVALFHAGRTTRLFFSGGPGDGPVDETAAMLARAVAQGVPRALVVRDTRGFDTAATVQNSAAYARVLHLRRLIAVSHAYHLPRVAGLYAREAQLEVHTDPAPMQHVMLKMPWFVAREAAALYVLWLDRALHRRTVPGR